MCLSGRRYKREELSKNNKSRIAALWLLLHMVDELTNYITQSVRISWQVEKSEFPIFYQKQTPNLPTPEQIPFSPSKSSSFAAFFFVIL